MAIKTYNDQNFIAIANAIRSKNGETTQYKPSEMAAAISAIETALEVLPQDTVSGAIANFPDGSNNYPVVELIANIAPKQAGSGDPAPDNVRAISGYTGMNITKQSKNLADGNMTQDGNNRVILCDNIYLKPGNYNISLTTTGTVANFYIKAHNGGSWSNVGGYNKTSVNVPISSADYYDISYYVSTGVNASDISNLQLEVGSSKTDYVPYSAPEVKTISWESEAGTVYGGSLNVTTGELTVDRILNTINSLTWEYQTTYNRFRSVSLSSIIAKPASNQVALEGLLSSAYVTSVANSSYASDKSVSVNVGGDLFIYDSTHSTVTDFLNDVGNQTILYPLDTPQTYQLEPEEVKTLLGVNNIYADTGDVEVTYRADVDLYIAKKIGE